MILSKLSLGDPERLQLPVHPGTGNGDNHLS